MDHVGLNKGLFYIIILLTFIKTCLLHYYWYSNYVYYIVPPPKARNMIFIIPNLSKIKFGATKCHGFLYCTADTQCWHLVNTKNVAVKNHCSRWAKKNPKQVPTVMLCNAYLKACNKKLLLKSFSQNQSSKHIFFKQILAPQVFSFTSFIFISVVTREDSRVAKIC